MPRPARDRGFPVQLHAVANLVRVVRAGVGGGDQVSPGRLRGRLPAVPDRVLWRKFSYSDNGANCVEVAFVGGAVVARDSKNPAGRAGVLAGSVGFVPG
ncbi:DUF397 domain-containing protein [Saccharopolyspora sp. NPDC000995]